MHPLRSSVIVAAFVFALPLGAAAYSAAANQQIPDSELGLFMTRIGFPMQCGDAAVMANKLRATKTTSTDPKLMHQVMKTYYACATGPYGKYHPSLYNTATFGFAAAALMAARHEPAAQALQDAKLARESAQSVAAYMSSPNANQSGPYSSSPSVYRTNSNRIVSDATALTAYLKAGGSTTSGSSMNGQGTMPAASAMPMPTH